jgi:hypothetical protein
MGDGQGEGPMKKAVHKITAIGIVLLLLNVPTLLSAAERRGANLVITLKDGQQIKGELIAVKTDSLLLLSPSRKDESVNTVDIKSIKVVRKSRAGTGFVLGLVSGILVGVLWGHNQPDPEENGATSIGALWGGGVGALIGLGVGAAASSDETIHFEGKSESDRAMALADLRYKARIPDFK